MQEINNSLQQINTRLKILNYFNLIPQQKDNRILLNCPSCNKREAFLYNDNHFIKCNRLNECNHSISLYDLISERIGSNKINDVKQFLNDIGADTFINTTNQKTKQMSNNQKEVYNKIPYSLQDFIDKKKLSKDFLKSYNICESDYFNVKGVFIPYYDSQEAFDSNKPLYKRVRNDNMKGKFRFIDATKIKIPYCIYEIDKFIDKSYIILVEGESDTLTLRYYGMNAIGISGAGFLDASVNRQEIIDKLNVFDNIYIYDEQDGGSDLLLKQAIKLSIASKIKIFTLKGLVIDNKAVEKDINDLHCIINDMTTQDKKKLFIDYIKKAMNESKDISSIQINENSTNNIKDKNIKTNNNNNDFNTLLKPYSLQELRTDLIKSTDAIKTGYSVGYSYDNEITPLELQSGALSIITAPTGHGKTTFLINTMLNIIEKYQDKQVYFLSYEEHTKDIVLKTFNVFLNQELSKNNLRTLYDFFKKYDGSNISKASQFISNKDLLHLSREQDLLKSKYNDFNELLESKRLNIKYIDFDVETLNEAITFIVNKEKASNNENSVVIMIDYIQLLNSKDNRSKSRQDELKDICNELRKYAIKNDVVVVLACQFNREVNSLDKLHCNSLAEGSNIEKSANLILGLWNKTIKEKKDKDNNTTNNKILKF